MGARDMKKLTGIILAVVFAAGMITAETIDRIVAKVNEEIITLSELNREMEPVRKEITSRFSGAQRDQALKEAEDQILDSLIESILVYQKAIELEYPAYVEDEVTGRIQQVMSDRNFRDTEEFETALAKEGLSMKSYRESIEKMLVSQAMVSDFINHRISLLTPEIERYYQNHQADFSTSEEVTLREIVLDTSKGVSEAETLAADIADRVLRGESFAEMASRYSSGSTAGKGGEIGTYVVERLNAEIRKVLEGVEEGKVSSAQKSSEGLIIYYVDARKPAAVKPLDEVRNEISNTLFMQKQSPEYERFITQLREEAYIQIFAELR